MKVPDKKNTPYVVSLLNSSPNSRFQFSSQHLDWKLRISLPAPSTEILSKDVGSRFYLPVLLDLLDAIRPTLKLLLLWCISYDKCSKSTREMNGQRRTESWARENSSQTKGDRDSEGAPTRSKASSSPC